MSNHVAGGSEGADTTEKIVAGRSPGKPRLDRFVFSATAIGALAFVAWGVLDDESLASAAGSAQKWVITNTGWLFVLVATAFVVYVIWLAVSRYGRIPLGADDEKPEFRTVSWIAMMFSAGMGIGLMFWGVAEPLSHYVSPPPHTAEPGTPAAAEVAMATTLFHWTLHPWAIYAVAGLAIAYGTFRKGRSQLISAVFQPLLGRHAEGIGGRAIDMMAIFATLFGSAASLGLGALQIGAGMEFNGWIDGIGKIGLVAIISGLTVAFVLSAVSGVERGIQWLSNINMVLALAIAAFVFVAGPTLFVLNMVPTSIGDYVELLPTMASRTGAGDEAMQGWLSSWTIFYWAWWISWTPFVGMFIARISRGRTIRQFVTGVLLVPSAVSLLWFAVFGGAGIAEQAEDGALTEADGSVDSNFALFHLLDQYPITSVTTVVVMILVGIFFVSGADAASIVMGTLSERGSIEPSRLIVIFWGAATGAVAAIMLVIADSDDLGGALTGLQALTTVVSLPFLVVMAAMCVSLYKDLREDPLILRADRGIELVEIAVDKGTERHEGDFALVTEPADDDVEKQSDPG
ncbi:BCCT family transporter [Nocardia rhizosphaerihabitans]|uniref:Choline transporter n=1 Tax=Nocardia rhizosphaerihabitans TaxID=1691570 RepID=A0ABQ2K6M5_9NOCA|nr:BCCT family transporter [Nocardia rhizosphaerihabitans]GGN68358.1 choline transporter [Nocardia rhizosphaerihabitans]